MNKTVTINISGIIFHIEDDAYDSLSKYLSKIKGYFSKTDGGNEIMSDIEARIAELLQARINVSKQVVLMVDVEHVTNVMGKPEDFGADQKEENIDQPRPDYTADEKIRRRLFRDPDEKVLGGVCSGLAAYFNIDTVWVRLAMFLLLFFGGLSLWVYIILWVVIPEANTTADKLAMRGEEANINTIFKTFKDEAEDLKNRGKRQYEDVSNTVRNNLSYARNTTAHSLNAFFNIIGRLGGLFFIFIGGMMLCAYAAVLFGISVLHSNNYIIHWKDALFESSLDYALGIFAFVIVIGIPIVMLIYSGVKLLFRVSYHNRWMNLSLGVGWLIGLIIGFYSVVSTLKQFGEGARLKETYTLHTTGDTILVKMNPVTTNLKTMKFDNNDDIETFFGGNDGGYFFGDNNGHLSVMGYVDLDVVESNSDNVEITISRISRGYNKKKANTNARGIEYAYQQDSNALILDQIFTVEEGAKFRAQEVHIRIMLPKGKVIYFDRSVKRLSNDIENTAHTWGSNMVSRRWKMTNKGLECIDCAGLENEEEIYKRHRRKKKDRLIIDEEGIEVNGTEAEIKIDEDGIRIKTPEKEIELKDDRSAEKSETKES